MDKKDRTIEEIKGHYDNGQLAEHYFADIQHDQYFGKFRRWYKDGTPQCDCEFNDDNRLVGIARWWWPNGQLQMISESVGGGDCGFFAEFEQDGTLVEADYTTESETYDIQKEVEAVGSDGITDEFIMMLRLKYYE
jgi:antitoxin component YwqK of YwqJK toxin-antitoxin module